MSISSITSANAVYMLGVLGLFPTAQQLENFSTDSAYDTEAVEMGVVEKGVDGLTVSGFVPYLASQSIMLQASSASNFMIDQVIAAEKVAKEKYVFFGTIRMKSIRSVYNLTGGILSRGSVMPAARRTLQPRTFTIVWDDITTSPM